MSNTINTAAQNILDYFNLLFLKNYAYSENEKFYIYHMNKYKDCLSARWKDGGTIGYSYNNEMKEVPREKEPKIGHLEEFLKLYYPNSNKQNIYQHIIYQTVSISDYYGGFYTEHRKQISLESLYNAIIEQTGEKKIDFDQYYDNCVMQYAHIMINIETKDYQRIKLEEKLISELNSVKKDTKKSFKI